jgi:hypothetical protein
MNCTPDKQAGTSKRPEVLDRLVTHGFRLLDFDTRAEKTIAKWPAVRLWGQRNAGSRD